MKLVHFVEWKKISDDEMIPTLKQLASWGVEELVAHPVWGRREACCPGYLKKTMQIMKDHGMNLPACHAYWGADADICEPDHEKRRKIIDDHADFLRKLAPWGIKTYTMHIGMEGKNGKTEWDSIRHAVEQLLPIAAETGIALALENGSEHHESQRELLKLIRAFAHPELGICFDTGHANCYGERDWKTSWSILGPEVVTCHMHDNYGTYDDHNPPGQGNLNWQELVTALKKAPRMLHAETESSDWSRESWEKFRETWERCPKKLQ